MALILARPAATAAMRLLRMSSSRGALASSTARQALLSAQRGRQAAPLPIGFPIFYPNRVEDALPPPVYYQPEIGGGYDVSGWTNTFECYGGVPLEFYNNEINYTRCVNRGAVTLADWAAGVGQYNYAASGTVAFALFGHAPEFGANVTYNGSAQYRLNNSSPEWQAYNGGLAYNAPPIPNLPATPPVAIPPWVAGPAAMLYPIIPALPDIIPEALPIGQFTRPPVALPRQALTAHRKAVRSGVLGPELAIDFGGWPSQTPALPSPSHIPARVTEYDLVSGAVTASSGGHHLRPPRRNERERKFQLRGSALALLRAANAISEGFDLLDSFYKALPRKHKIKFRDTNFLQKDVTPQDKARQVWKHFDTLDVPSVIANALQNEIEDRMIGKAGRGIRSNQLEALPYVRPVGWQFGAYKTRYNQRVAQSRNAQSKEKGK